MTNDALRVIERTFGNDPGWADSVSRAAIAGEIAEALYALRVRHGLTQAALAKRAGTSQSAIARMESADYHGHSLSMLRRIAASVGERLTVAFIEPEPPAAPSSPNASTARRRAPARPARRNST
jgi:transcriptional regulator with XRE-family HTH domain